MKLGISGARRSLSLRLLLYAGISIALALGAAWIVLGLLFERHSERQLQTELERHGVALIAALDIDASGRPTLQRQPSDPRFDRPASGLYWRIVAPGYELRSRSLWDGALPTIGGTSASGWNSISAKGAYEDRVLMLARSVRPSSDGPSVLVQVAADRQTVSAARAAFGQESALFLAVLWLALAVAAWVQVRLGLKPLDHVRAQLELMSRTPSSRLPEDEHPVEIRPLTTAINAFADRRAEDVERARRRARDLAHAFKTPITALRLQIATLDDARAQEMGRSLSLITGAVEGELARSEATEADQQVDACMAVGRLLAVIAKTPDGARLALGNDVPAGLLIPMSLANTLEALGALIENAARHASSEVRVCGGTENDAVWLTICDDGAGISDELRMIVLNRGVRLDEQGSRHGLGLSIAQDFVVASGGSIALEDADLGGLCVRLLWVRSGIPE